MSAASLAWFRILFGAVLVLDAASYLIPRPELNRIHAYYTGPHVHWTFPYHGFEWARPLPEAWLTLVVVLYGVAGLALCVGFCARRAAAAVVLLYGYLFLLDETHYNNHYYLTLLLAALLATMPSATMYSVDRLRRHRGKRDDDPTIPFWPVFLLRAQLAAVYVFAAVAKMTPMWLLYAEPMRTWLAAPETAARATRFLPASWADAVASLLAVPATAFVLSYAGLLFDLTIAALLLIPRTRWPAILLLALFHALNHFVIFVDIALFPLMAVGISTIFLEPDWPQRLAAWVRRPRWRAPQWSYALAGMVLLPLVGFAAGWRMPADKPSPRKTTGSVSNFVVFAVLAWVAVQWTLPLRHFLIPGRVDWTAEGERFSWRMKTGIKQVTHLAIEITDPELVTLNNAGRPTPDWQALGGQRFLLEHVDAARCDYRRMPELMVHWQPFYGERIIYNPAQSETGQPRSREESVERIATYWVTNYGRQPARVRATFPLSRVLDEAAKQLLGVPLTRAQAQHLQNARALAQQLEAARTADAHSALVTQLHADLQALASANNGDVSSTIRRAVAVAHPFATEGAPAPAVAPMLVDDPAVLTASPQGNYVLLDRDAWRPAYPQAHIVYADTRWLVGRQWIALPRIVPIRQAGGNLQLVWNQFADLMPGQVNVMLGRPYMCHQYAQRVAGLWHQRFGRRPTVHFRYRVALLPYTYQTCIDPGVDLAAAPLRLWGHNAWIEPLEPTIDSRYRDTGD